MAAVGRRAVLWHFTAAVVLAACGLAWRMVPLGLPLFWLKYGGSVLWGAMVLLLVGAFQRRGMPSWMVAAIAVVIAGASELFRLVHVPALDAFRLTLPGALLLGRVFNPANVVAYALGIVAALPFHVAVSRAKKIPLGSGSREAAA